MNDNYYESLPNTFPRKGLKNPKYISKYEIERSERTFDLRRAPPITFQRSKTYHSKLSESMNLLGSSKIIPLNIDKQSHNFSDDSKDLSNEEFLEQTTRIINSNDDQQIYQFISTFTNLLDTNEIKARLIFDKIVRSEEFIDIIIEAINNTDCDTYDNGFHAQKIKKALFDVISLIYPLSDQEERNHYIDQGLCFSLLNTLSSDNGTDLLKAINVLVQITNKNGQVINNNLFSTNDISKTQNHFLSTLSLHESSFNLISKLVEPSIYARDSILSLGIHEIIADIIESISNYLYQNNGFSKNIEFYENMNCLLILSSNSLEAIFDNLKDIDRKVVFDFIPKLIRLLRIGNLKVSYNIIQILLYIVRIFPSTAYTLFENENGEIKQHILSILVGDRLNPNIPEQFNSKENEELIELTLKLLGNLCHTKPSEVISLYSSGLCNILRALMTNPKLITETLWVLSNLYEVITEQMINEITPDFITEMVNYTKNCNFDCKLETGYFLATIIFFSPASMIKSFIIQEIIDIIVEVLGCGLPKIVDRSANAIARLVHYAQMVNEYEPLLSFLEVSDLKGRLRELLDDDTITVWLDNSVGLDEFYKIICDIYDTYQ